MPITASRYNEEGDLLAPRGGWYDWQEWGLVHIAHKIEQDAFHIGIRGYEGNPAPFNPPPEAVEAMRSALVECRALHRKLVALDLVMSGDEGVDTLAGYLRDGK